MTKSNFAIYEGEHDPCYFPVLHIVQVHALKKNEWSWSMVEETDGTRGVIICLSNEDYYTEPLELWDKHLASTYFFKR